MSGPVAEVPWQGWSSYDPGVAVRPGMESLGHGDAGGLRRGWVALELPRQRESVEEQTAGVVTPYHEESDRHGHQEVYSRFAPAARVQEQVQQAPCDYNPGRATKCLAQRVVHKPANRGTKSLSPSSISAQANSSTTAYPSVDEDPEERERMLAHFSMSRRTERLVRARLKDPKVTWGELRDEVSSGKCSQLATRSGYPCARPQHSSPQRVREAPTPQSGRWKQPRSKPDRAECHDGYDRGNLMTHFSMSRRTEQRMLDRRIPEDQ